MKIKQERKVRLDGLIDYVWKNKTRGIYYDQFGYAVVFNNLGHLKLDSDICYDSIFTITEEVEITDNTELKYVIAFTEHGGSPFHYKKFTLRKLKKAFHRVYLLNEDETQFNLIWSKEDRK